MTDLYAPGANAQNSAQQIPGVGKSVWTSASSTAGNGADTASDTKQDWKAQKEEQARIRKRQNDLKKIETEIEKLETRDAEIDELLTQEEIYTDVSRLVELNKEKEALQTNLETLYAQWEELAE